MNTEHYILLALLGIAFVGAMVRMTVKHRQNMRKLDERHADFLRRVAENHERMKTVLKLAHQSAIGEFTPDGRVVDVGPGCYVVQYEDGTKKTIFTD